jgi:hypothetical protein
MVSYDHISRWGIILLPLILLALGSAPVFGQVTLVKDGKPTAVILLPANPQDDEILAAAELAEHIKLISGADLPKTTGQAPAGQVPIRLGAAADPALEGLIREKGSNPSAFALVVDAKGVSIRGQSAEGTLFGVYELLEQLGVRWYMPGELGRVIPKLATVTVKPQRTVQVPSFDQRTLQHVSGLWTRRVRLGGEQRSTGAHGIPPFSPNSKLFAEHPEYFGLVGGQRRARQACLSNPEVLKLAAQAIRNQLKANPNQKYIGLGPNDGGGHCECAECAKLDGGVHDPFRDGESHTDRYVWFYNQLLDELKEYPNLHIVTYIYASYIMPPAKVTPNPRIVAVFAPITLDRIRGMDNPMSPDRHAFRYIIDEWSKFGLNEMYYRGYYNNLACPQFPISQVDRIRHETPVFREKGINVMRVEVILPSWSMNTPTLYLAPRMMWDVKTDVDALLEEFYQKFYGPASAPMGQYYEALDAAFRDTPYMTGGSYPYLVIFDDARRTQFRGYLDNAARLAGPQDDKSYGERVWAVRIGFDRMEAFLDMIAARNRHDYATALAKLNEMNALADRMNAYVLESNRQQLDSLRLLSIREQSSQGGSYINRFWSGPVKSGHHRLVEAGELVAGLPDEWQFLLDPTDIGEISGYFRPGPLGGNWRPMKTSSMSWSDQGLHYYRGIAWYRTAVTVPEQFRGRRILLWIGGVDEVGKVWVNGQLLGSNREPNEGLPGVPGTFRAFDLDATKAVKFGEPNTVSVRITNLTTNELGTGGITGPVMFWSPRDPNWKPG